MTNPIFLIGTAIALIIANFDKLLSLIDGVSSAEQENLETQKQKTQLKEDELKTLELQENSLRLQGKTEEEILEIQIQKTDEAIKQQQIVVETQKQLTKQQIS